MTPSPDYSLGKLEEFVTRWQGQEGGQERANYALFLTELCDVLNLPHPDVAKATHVHNDYGAALPAFLIRGPRRGANSRAAGSEISPWWSGAHASWLSLPSAAKSVGAKD